MVHLMTVKVVVEEEGNAELHCSPRPLRAMNEERCQRIRPPFDSLVRGVRWRGPPLCDKGVGLPAPCRARAGGLCKRRHLLWVAGAAPYDRAAVSVGGGGGGAVVLKFWSELFSPAQNARSPRHHQLPYGVAQRGFQGKKAAALVMAYNCIFPRECECTAVPGTLSTTQRQIAPKAQTKNWPNHLQGGGGGCHKAKDACLKREGGSGTPAPPSPLC